MPGVLLPIALAALTALVVPLLLHLARRDEQKPTLFAALAWLRQKPRPQQRLRFDEWPLLVLRLLLLTLLAIFLARPVLFDGADKTPYVAVVPGIDPAQVTEAKARQHWLAPGFPDLDSPAPRAGVPVASLLRQLDSELPQQAKLIVYVPAQMQGADAERLRLSRTVDWRIVSGAMPASPIAVTPPALVVRYAPEQINSVRYFRATAAAWQSGFSAGPISEPVPAHTKILIWLAPGPLPAAVTDWVRRGGTVLTSADTVSDGMKTAYWRANDGAVLIEGQGRTLRFTRPLTPASLPQLLDADFPQHLRDVLTGSPPAPSRVDARDYAPVQGASAYVAPAMDLQPWLAVLIGLVLLAERWLATSRRRGVAP